MNNNNFLSGKVEVGPASNGDPVHEKIKWNITRVKLSHKSKI